MLGATGIRQAVEKPSALQLAIREWQRQLIEMAEAAKPRAMVAPPVGDDWSADSEMLGDD